MPAQPRQFHTWPPDAEPQVGTRPLRKPTPHARKSACQQDQSMTGHQSQEFTFVVETVNPISEADTKARSSLVKSHASRARATARRTELRSWILRRHCRHLDTEGQYLTLPRQLQHSEFVFLQDIVELRPYMASDIANALSPMRDALYPPEICLQVDPSSSSWVTNLLADTVYLHCTIFSVEAFLDACHRREQSSLTQYHFLKTIRLLQRRLDTDNGKEIVSDATIMVVVVLGLTAELIGDRSAAEYHMKGLGRMVHLRGGFDALRQENPRLPSKICRVDLSLALRFGCKPLFFEETMNWDEVLHSSYGLRNSINKTNSVDEVSVFLKRSDDRLFMIWKDLQQFSRLCNLAAQTSHKMAPNLFSEILVSVLYRLLHLSATSSELEAFRLGMITFASQVFYQWRGIRQRQQDLDARFLKSLLGMQAAGDDIPSKGSLWLFVMAVGSTSIEELDSEVLTCRTRFTLDKLAIKYSQDVRALLKPIMWIDFLQDVQLAKFCKRLSVFS